MKDEDKEKAYNDIIIHLSKKYGTIVTIMFCAWIIDESIKHATNNKRLIRKNK